MSPLAQLPEPELVGRIARGDAEALREAWRRTSSLAFGMALRILRSRSEAEETLQETFIEVWRRARTFEPGRGSLSGWVLTLARSKAIDRARARTRRAAITASSGEPSSIPPPEAPLQALLQRDEELRVGGALKALPAEQREVIELAYFEGLTLREVAERTGAPLGTVKTRARTALLKLGGLLGVAPERVA